MIITMCTTLTLRINVNSEGVQGKEINKILYFLTEILNISLIFGVNCKMLLNCVQQDISRDHKRHPYYVELATQY